MAALDLPPYNRELVDVCARALLDSLQKLRTQNAQDVDTLSVP
jgi:hypothetical protein